MTTILLSKKIDKSGNVGQSDIAGSTQAGERSPSPSYDLLIHAELLFRAFAKTVEKVCCASTKGVGVDPDAPAGRLVRSPDRGVGHVGLALPVPATVAEERVALRLTVHRHQLTATGRHVARAPRNSPAVLAGLWWRSAYCRRIEIYTLSSTHGFK